MLAAEQIEWCSEHPAYLWSLHPCEDIWDERDIESSEPANDNGQRLVALTKTFPEQPIEAATNKDITFPRTRDAAGGARSEGEAGPSAGQSPRTGTGWGLTQVEVGLVYFGKRFLNPLLGRWVSADPLAVHAPGEADPNLYAYVSGAVLKNVDPLGLEAEDAIRRWVSRLAQYEGSNKAWHADKGNAVHDRGGETAWGITWNTYQQLRPKGTKEEFRAMTSHQAESMASGMYRRGFNADRIKHDGVGVLMAEHMWASQGKEATRALNRTLRGLGQKGGIRPSREGVTKDLAIQVNAVDSQAFADAYIKEREAAHARIGGRYQYGWDRRWRDRWIQFKVDTGHAGDAAKWLNGQSQGRTHDQFAFMTPAEVRAVRDAAVNEPGVGKDARIVSLADDWLAKHPEPAADQSNKK